MEQERSSRWQAFAQTGGVSQYLSYKQADAAGQPPQKGALDERDRDPGAGAAGGQIRGSR